MLGAFLFPFGHLLFDDAGIDAVVSRFGKFPAHFSEQRFVLLLKGIFGASIALR